MFLHPLDTHVCYMYMYTLIAFARKKVESFFFFPTYDFRIYQVYLLSILLESAASVKTLVRIDF